MKTMICLPQITHPWATACVERTVAGNCRGSPTWIVASHQLHYGKEINYVWSLWFEGLVSLKWPIILFPDFTSIPFSMTTLQNYFHGLDRSQCDKQYQINPFLIPRLACIIDGHGRLWGEKTTNPQATMTMKFIISTEICTSNNRYLYVNRNIYMFK